jgi:hypothetical protein
MPTVQELEQSLLAADKAGDIPAAQAIASDIDRMIKAQQPQQKSQQVEPTTQQPSTDNLGGFLKGDISDIPGHILDTVVKPYAKVGAGFAEPIARIGTGLVGNIAGQVGGLASLPAAIATRFGVNNIPEQVKRFSQENLGFDPSRLEIDPKGIQEGIQNTLTYQPKTDAGKSGNNPINYVTGKIGHGVNYLGNKVADPIRGDSSNPFREAGANAAKEAVAQSIGFLGIPAGKALTKQAGKINQALQHQKALNAVKDTVAKQGVDAGLSIPPNALNEAGILSRSLNSLGGKPATNQLARAKNEAAFNNLAREQLGVSKTAPLNESTINTVIEGHIQKGYKPIENIPKIKTDAQFQADLQAAISKNKGSGDFPKALNNDVALEVAKYSEPSFSGAGAIEAIRQLRARANELYSSPAQGAREVAGALKDTAKALETQVERHLSFRANAKNAINEIDESFTKSSFTRKINGPDFDSLTKAKGVVNRLKNGKITQNSAIEDLSKIPTQSKTAANALHDLSDAISKVNNDVAAAAQSLKAYTDARKGIAQAKTYGEAIKEGSGSVSSTSLSSALNKGKPLEGNQRLIAEFNNQYGPSISGKSLPGDKAPFSVADLYGSLVGAGGAATSAAFGNIPGTVLGTLAAGLPVARAGARNLSLSRALQERLANPSYSSTFANVAEPFGYALPSGVYLSAQDKKRKGLID